MANYITTDTDLTAVANAIRNQTGGNNTLSWPNGFTTNINNITSYISDGHGTHPQLITTLYDESIKLADTNWNNIDFDTASLSTVVLDSISVDYLTQLDRSLYDYRIEEIVYINYVYKNNTQVTCGGLETFNIVNKIEFKYPKVQAVYSSSSLQEKIYVYKDNNENITYDTLVNGISIASQSYTFTPSKFTYKTPKYTLSINATKFSREMLKAVDADNTYIDITTKLYAYDKNSTSPNRISADLLQLYNSKHPQS